MAGRTNKLLSYLQSHYDGAVIQVSDVRIDVEALNAFVVFVPELGRVCLLLSWNPETHRAVVTVNLPEPQVRFNAA